MVAEVLGRVWSSGVSLWYMRSNPMCLRLLFVVRSAWRFVLVCSSVLSVCCFVSVTFAVPVCNSQSVLRLLTGVFASFVGHPSCFGLRSWKVVVRFQWHWVGWHWLLVFRGNSVVFVAVGSSSEVVVVVGRDFSRFFRCSPSWLVCSEPVCCRPHVYNMPPPPRSTNNSLSAGFSQDGLPSSSAASLVPASGSAGSGPPLSADAIANAVVCALGSSLPAILASLPGNASSPADSVAPASSSAPPIVTSADVHVASGASTQSSCTYMLPLFVLTFTPLTATTDSSSALGAPIAATGACASFGSILPDVDNVTAWPKAEKAFTVGPGHAPIPAKLVSKMTGGEFVELAELLSVNLRQGVKLTFFHSSYLAPKYTKMVANSKNLVAIFFLKKEINTFHSVILLDRPFKIDYFHHICIYFNLEWLFVHKNWEDF